MAEPEDDKTGGWRPGRLAPNTEAVSNWVFFTDPLRQTIVKPETRLPITVGLRSGQIETLGMRLEGYREVANKRLNGDQIEDLGLVVPEVYTAETEDPKQQEQQEQQEQIAPEDGLASTTGTAEATAEDAEPDDYFTILSNRELFRLLATPVETSDPLHPSRDIFFIVHGPGLPNDAIAVETARALPDPGNGPPMPGVTITAVIDNGIPILHDRFLDAAGDTRVRYAWVQDGVAQSPSFVPYGREFEAADIDALRTAHMNGPQLDETAAYAEAGLAEFGQKERHAVAWRTTHGSVISDLAAGYPDGGPSFDNPVITVQLPQYVTADTSGSSLGTHLLAAIDYIFDRADRIAVEMGSGRLPLVINFSYGVLGGPHDGKHFLERAIDKRLAKRNASGIRTAMVLPSGNRHLSQCHARLVAGQHFTGPGNTATLDWRVQPDDFTASFVEIWMPKGPPSASRLSVEFLPPGSAVAPSPPLDETDGATQEWKPGGTDVVAMLAYEYFGPPVRRGRFLLTVQATARHDPTVDLAPSGTWRIRMTDTGLSCDDTINAWVLRDDALPGFDTLARQSRFSDAAYERLDEAGVMIEDDPPAPTTPIRRQGLQNAIATGRHTIVVGGFDRKSARMAYYSSGGLTSGPRRGPDVATLSDTSRVHLGQLGAGANSGSVVLLDGTSVAAPQVARRVASEFANGVPVAPADVQNWAAVDESTGSYAGLAPQPPDYRAQGGRLDLPPVYPTRRIEE